eukprot:m.8208 g.8208  ORF g.8208 m.8208 type:complete len:336 (+) comp5189_c0_seq1:1-1008(+)
MAVCVVGAGRMGHRIAADFALGEYNVVLVDRSLADLQAAMANIRALFDEHILQNLFTQEAADAAYARITANPNLAEAVRGCPLIVECVPDVESLKRPILQTIFANADAASTVLSNTISLPVQRLAAMVPAPERLVGLRFLHPVLCVAKVVLTLHPNVADPAIAAVRVLAGRLHKQVEVRQCEDPSTAILTLAEVERQRAAHRQRTSVPSSPALPSPATPSATMLFYSDGDATAAAAMATRMDAERAALSAANRAGIARAPHANEPVAPIAAAGTGSNASMCQECFATSAVWRCYPCNHIAFCESCRASQPEPLRCPLCRDVAMLLPLPTSPGVRS